MQKGNLITRRFLPVFLCLMAIILTACSGNATTTSQQSDTTPASADKQVMTEPVIGIADLTTLDPALASDIPSINAIDMCFTGLVSLNDKLQVQDQLAHTYQESSDGLTYTFKLKSNLKFSDGTALTSTDVAYSIDRALDPNLKSGVAPTYLGLIKDANLRNTGKVKSLIGDSLLTPDSQTLVIKLSQPAAYFSEALGYNTSYVVEKKLIDKYGTNFTDHLNEGGCSGPFKVQTYQHGKQIVFVPNPYYDGARPKLQKFILTFYKDENTAYEAYQNGQLNLTSVPTIMVPNAKSLSKNQYHAVPILATTFIGMNYLTKPFDNVKIRQAFALALNKTALAHNIMKDSVKATNHIVPSGQPGYNANLTGPDGVKGTDGDPTLAKQLLEEGMQEEGLTAATFPKVTFTASSNGSADNTNLFSAMQQMWKNNLGINVTIQDIDFDTLLKDANEATNNPKGIQMWYADWYADYPDPQDWLTLLFGKNAAKNGMNYGQNSTPNSAEQQKNQDLMLQADANANSTARMQQYNQAEQALVNDVAWIPIAQKISPQVIKPCVKGIIDNAQDLTPPDDWGSIYISNDPTCANAG